ncbi:MAG: hypothetical protein OEY44_03040 [Candidatus Peregrinibacteria bacterium]|nr:hypothetical protein [Candidatus Peregrinibacteria bacterium]
MTLPEKEIDLKDAIRSLNSLKGEIPGAYFRRVIRILAQLDVSIEEGGKEIAEATGRDVNAIVDRLKKCPPSAPVHKVPADIRRKIRHVG